MSRNYGLGLHNEGLHKRWQAEDEKLLTEKEQQQRESATEISMLRAEVQILKEGLALQQKTLREFATASAELADAHDAALVRAITHLKNKFIDLLDGAYMKMGAAIAANGISRDPDPRDQPTDLPNPLRARRGVH